MKYFDIRLASASPRRAELIKKIPWLRATVFPSEIEEPPYSGGDTAWYACFLARLKAEDVLRRCGGVVVGADTIVCCGESVLGKPKDGQHAESMFRMLCGRTHEVITGICVANERKILVDYEKTYVTFRAFDREIVYNYINSGAPMDKAGGYGLQDPAIAMLIDKVEGNVDNVIGLPVATLEKTLKEFL